MPAASTTETRIYLLLAITLFFLSGCGESVRSEPAARLLSMGDSMLAWNAASSNTIADEIEKEMGEPVIDRSVIGARFLYGLPISGAAGLNISKQYRPGNWDWIVLNGGGNDLWFGCGCALCDHTIDRMISKDSKSGKIPELVSRITARGARVIYVGYLHSPGSFSIIDHCKGEDIELESRIANLAKQDPAFFYLKNADLVPYGDLSCHEVDRIHPSVKASREIGRLVSQLIYREDRRTGRK